MSLRGSGTWWSQHSLIRNRSDKTALFSESCRLVRYEIVQPDEKHTFFPGNEILRNRVNPPAKYLLKPDSCLKLAFDCVIYLFTLCLCVVVPYSISFFYDFPIELYLVISVFFTIDIIFSFNTVYYESGVPVTSYSKIAKRYIASWFLIDIVSFIPLELLINLSDDYDSPHIFSSTSDYLRLFFLLKLMKIFKVKLYIKIISELSTDSMLFAIIEIVIQIIFITLPLHWICCIYNSLYAFQIENKYFYFKNVKYSNKDRYLAFFDRALQTLTAVGYGDYPILSSQEKLFTIFVELLTSGFFGYFIGKIENIITRSTEISIFFRKAKTKFRILCNKYKLKKSLKSKIDIYIRHLITTYKEHSIKDEDFINLLSIPLKEQVFLCSKGYVLLNTKYFKILSRPCIKSISHKLVLKFFAPNDVIFNENNYDRPEVFFISSGAVKIFHWETKTVFANLKQDNIFGDLHFLLNNGRSASAQSLNFSELLCLDRFDVDKILQRSPKDKDKFLSIIRNLKTYGHAFIGISCYLCGKTGHLAKSCEKFIWKPLIRKKVFKTSGKLVNSECPPSPYRKEKSVTLNHSLANTVGLNILPEKVFGKNKYLVRKSNEYSRFLDVQTNQLKRILSLVNEEEKSFLGSAESESDIKNSLDSFQDINIENL